jgi:hypothetical protein
MGLAQVAFPLTDPVEEAIRNIEIGIHNWVQLSLNKPPTQFVLVTSRTVSPDEIQSSVDTKSPQFYLYNSNGTLVVIFYSPESRGNETYAQALQTRMVYATAKSSLLDAVVNLKLNLPVRKYDIRDLDDLTDSTLNQHLQSKASEIIAPKSLVGPYHDSTPDRTIRNRVAASPLAHVIVGGSVGGRPLPRGVVIPPKGAHC